MAKNKPNNSEDNSIVSMKQERLLAGFQAAVDLKIYEGELVWSRFSTILTTQTILFAAIGFFIQNGSGINKDNVFSFLFLSIVGLLISFFWFEMTSRGFTFNSFWAKCAREMEAKISQKDFEMFKKGKEFSENKTVEFDYGKGVTEKYQRPWYAQIFKTETAAKWIIIIFLIGYFVLFIYSLSIFICYN